MNPSLTRRRFLQTTGTTALAAVALPQTLAARGGSIVVALVGCAHIHTPAFVKLLAGREDVQVKWVWDHDYDRADKSARQLGATMATDVQQVWSDPMVQAAVICSETDRHLDLVLAGAKAGKHLFVEKPLGMDVKDSKRMADAIEAANVLFATGYFMRGEPIHQFLKDQVARGHFGTITRVRGSCCHSGALDRWFDQEWRWMADPKQAGVGAFGDLGTHKLDLLMWLIGDVDSVTASIKTVKGRYEGCDDSGEGLMRFRDGTTGTLAAGWVAVADPVTLMISGTEGHATVFNGQLYFKSKHVEGATGGEPWTKLPPALPKPLDQFLAAVGGDAGQPLVTAREAADRVGVMSAMYAASRKHKWIQVG